MGRSWLKCAADPLESSDEQAEEQASALACKKAPPVSPAAAALRDTAHLAAQMEAANSAVAAANKALELLARDAGMMEDDNPVRQVEIRIVGVDTEALK